MRTRFLVVTIFLAACTAFAQSDRGTITGPTADPTGAVVANAAVEAANTATGAVYKAESTATGNYTLSELPAGVYRVEVTVPGFKKYVREGLTVEVAQTLRIDIPLEVGQASESITVNADAALLKTESGELSQNVTSDRVDNLPTRAKGNLVASKVALQTPQAVTQLVPGAYFVSN